MSMEVCCGPEADLAKRTLPRLLWAGTGAAMVFGAIGTLASHPWTAIPAGIGLVVAGGLCSINAAASKRVHCTFTGPLFLGLGAVALLNTAWTLFPWAVLWALLAAGTLIAFVPEMRGRVYWGAARSPAVPAASSLRDEVARKG